MDIIIRPACPEDAARLAHMELEPEARPWLDLPPEADYGREAWVRSNVDWITRPDHHCVVAALADGTVIGSVTLQYEAGQREGVCMGLVVDPAFQGRGVGGALMRWLVDTADTLPLSRVYLAVHRENHRAIALYTRHGFVYDGVTPNGCDRMFRRHP